MSIDGNKNEKHLAGSPNARRLANARADAILAITPEEARERLEIAKDSIRVLGVDCPERVWREKRQMLAILNREEIDSDTLT